MKKQKRNYFLETTPNCKFIWKKTGDRYTMVAALFQFESASWILDDQTITFKEYKNLDKWDLDQLVYGKLKPLTKDEVFLELL
jgi:hypothetical protein